MADTDAMGTVLVILFSLMHNNNTIVLYGTCHQNDAKELKYKPTSWAKCSAFSAEVNQHTLISILAAENAAIVCTNYSWGSFYF